MNSGKLADILGIIGVVGAIVAGFLGALIASQLMILLSVIYIIGFLAFKLWQLDKENKHLKDLIVQKTTAIEVDKHFDEPVKITSKPGGKHPTLIAADFILWNEYTIMLWVNVPLMGLGLRDSGKNRCLFSHTTGWKEKEGNFNGFTLRHLKDNDKNQWQFSFSNDNAKYLPKGIYITDDLEPGWHQFLIEWTKLAPKPELKVLIDKVTRARSSNFLPYWPEKHAENMMVGAFNNGDMHTYCETDLQKFWICNKYLALDNEIIQLHYSRGKV